MTQAPFFVARPLPRSSPGLSRMASRALSQVSPKGGATAVTVSLTAAAALGIAAGVIPKREKTLRNAAIGGSVIALAVTGLLFMLGD